jgi:hypothetical protein
MTFVNVELRRDCNMQPSEGMYRCFFVFVELTGRSASASGEAVESDQLPVEHMSLVLLY